MKKLKMKPHNTKGMLITVCGLDGCGKTTLIQKLKREIENSGRYEVFITKQPSESLRNSNIFRTYMDCEDHSKYDYRSLSLMAVADRIQHVNKIILPELEKGKCVICDRYFYSCLANLRARGYEKDNWIYDVAKLIVRPDVSVFLDVSVPIAVDRVRERAEEKDRYIDMGLQYRLREEYVTICRKNQGVLIPSAYDKDQTFNQAYECVNDFFEKGETK